MIIVCLESIIIFSSTLFFNKILFVINNAHNIDWFLGGKLLNKSQIAKKLTIFHKFMLSMLVVYSKIF